VTDKLENRITEIEVINKKLTKISAAGRGASLRSTCSQSSVSISTTSSISLRDNKSTSSSTSQPTNAAKAISTSRVCRHGQHRHRLQQPANSICSVTQQQAALCSNRAIHISVIVLVAVMALCLLSITVLYVVDRKVGSQTNSAILLQHSTNSTSNILLPVEQWAPLLPIHCDLVPSDCPYTCCSAPSPSPLNDPVAAATSTPAVSSSSTTVKTFYKSTRSPNDIHQHLDEIDHQRKIFKQQLQQSNTVLQSTEVNDISELNHLPLDVQNLKQNDVSNKVVTMDDPSNGKGRWVGDLMAILFLKQLNLSISPTYCIDSMCRTQMGGNYTYSVPLNAHFPLLPVTLQFIMKIYNPPLYVNICNSETKAQCSLTTSDVQIRKISNMEWDMPLGFYHNSIFKFRIGATQTVCDEPKEDVGNTFVEYNLYFYRVCTGS
jgi:hypothetical protein